MNLQAADITDLGLQVADHACAFYNGGNDVYDIVVDRASQGLQAGRRCVSLGDRVSSVRDPVPGELITRERILPFVAEDGVCLRGGALSRDALLGIGEALVTGALGDSYQRIWPLGNVSFVVRSARLEDVLGRVLEPDRFTSRYPQLLMCLCDLDLFDGEAAMGMLRTHPRIRINWIIVPNSRCIPTRQFLGTP